MKLIIEVDGPILDVQPAYWYAYQVAVAELGWARIDPSTFWRLIRTGASEGQILRGSKVRHWKHYADRFAAVVDADECVARMRPQADVVGPLKAIRRRYPLVTVTIAANKAARERLLLEHGMLDALHGIEVLGGSLAERARRIAELASDMGRPVVAAGTEAFARAAGEAGICCVGVSNGPCTSKRLRQVGAAEVYNDVGGLAAALEACGIAALGARRQS